MSPAKRINILVYSGAGASLASVRHATWSLRRLLGPNYAVLTVTSDQILKEPWPASTAMLVMPGGADSGYCRILNGEGNRRIRQYVQMGGKYLGLCAGGYYGSSDCEFEVGRKGMEVVGERELAFFPGVCRGLALPGFVYASEAGARVVDLKVNHGALGTAIPCENFKSYYNGGGAFVDAETFDGVEVLASFSEELAVDSGKKKAAVVYCKVGAGAAILTGPHPEFAGVNLTRDEPSNANYGEIIDALLADDMKRTDFMKACLTKLGLEVSQETPPVPSLSRLHLSSALHGEIPTMLRSWHEAGIVATEGGGIYIKGEQDTFRLEKPDGWSMTDVAKALADVVPDSVKNAATSVLSTPKHTVEADTSSPDRILDYNAVIKHILLHTSALPDIKSTPHFNHHAFYANLEHYQTLHPEISGDYGRVLLYGEVVTSTQSILDKNPTLLSNLPIGTTATATTQLVGRGRGTNVWVAPPGSLVFSTVLKHSLSLSSSAPVVFVQYLAAMAIVAGIHNYDKGYKNLPIRLKWPNDVYALDPTTPAGEEDRYVKISGVLVNSSYSGGDYTLVVGIGLNALNAAPTTSLRHLAQKAKLQPPSLERLLASILVNFEALYARFCRTGWDKGFEERYYNMWLHSDQIVTLEVEGGARARIKGITRDFGLLVAEELGFEDRSTGKRWELQSDSNSFDFFKGLVKRKV